MNVLWRKAWRDLWRNKLRTFLVVLSTAVGVFALGLVFGLFLEMRTRMAQNYRETSPAHIQFHTGWFSQDVLPEVLRAPGVADAEAYTQVSFRWRREDEVDWRNGTLVARPDYQAQRLSQIDLVEGRWPAERALAVERLSSRHFDLVPGTTLLVDSVVSGSEEGARKLRVEGVVRDARALPPQLGFGGAAFFADPATVAWLVGQDVGRNQIGVRLDSFSEEEAIRIAGSIERRLESRGLVVVKYIVQDPNVHWAQDQLNTAFLISMVLGVLSLGLTTFLIINTTTAILAQQVRQIGVIKVVGATSGLVTSIYLAMALAYGLLSLLLAVPVGAVAAHLAARWLLDLVNVTVGDFRAMPLAVAIQVAVGLAVPLLASLVPVLRGARTTPHQAITNYGLGSAFGVGRFDRLLGRAQRLPSLLAIGLRNTFRRKTRIALTLLALVLSGVMFIVVMSVDRSLGRTIEALLEELSRDVQVGFDYLFPVAMIAEVTEQVPGVAKVEVWGYWGAQIATSSGAERPVYLWGVPSGSEMFGPRIASGRPLLAGDDRAILLNSHTAADEGIEAGDEIRLVIGEKESVWKVVGLIVSPTNSNYVPFDALALETHTVGMGSTAMVIAEGHDLEAQERLIRDLRDAYTARGIEASRFNSAEEIRRVNRSMFDIVTNLMLIMVAMAAAVGGIGLMSTMSINVVERGREIGVLRAVGATSTFVGGVFVVEGVLVGVLSWTIALPLSYPGALVFGNAIGYSLIRAPLSFSYSVGAGGLWLLIVVSLSALASLWPALRAAQVSVRESLAYE